MAPPSVEFGVTKFCLILFPLDGAGERFFEIAWEDIFRRIIPTHARRVVEKVQHPMYTYL